VIAHDLTGLLIDTLLTTGALIAAVLVVRRPAARLFGPGVAYALWALPLIRMMLPPLVLPASLRPVADVAAAHVAQAPSAVVILTNAAPVATAAPAAAISWPLVLLALWLAGAVLFLAARTHSYLAMRRSLLADARPMGTVGTIRIIESPAVECPVAFGVRDRVVALPLGFLFRTDPAARELAVAHELEHHAARDLAVNIAFQPLLALHWFNPLAWLAWRAMRQDQEAACDARVLAGRGREERHRYGQLIATAATGRPGVNPRLSLAAAMAGPVLGRKAIVHRLRRIAAAEPSKALHLAGVSALALAVLALPLTATISYASDDAKGHAPAKREVRRIVIRQDETRDGPPAHERTVQRGDRTYVFRTDAPLSDAEIEARIAKADTEMPDPPEPPEPPEMVEPAEPAMPPMPPEPPMPKLQAAAGDPCGAIGERTFDATTGRVNHAAMAELHACIQGQVRASLREAGIARADARTYQAAARDAIREAQAEIAQDKSLTADIRAMVIDALDNAMAGVSTQS
jgi:beta-lactamase regulating signal transducer with metallopeptidase domain